MDCPKNFLKWWGRRDLNPQNPVFETGMSADSITTPYEATFYHTNIIEKWQNSIPHFWPVHNQWQRHQGFFTPNLRKGVQYYGN